MSENQTGIGGQTHDYSFEPVPFTKVLFTDSFWAPRLETNRRVTIPYDFKKCEETGRIDNFAKAGDLMEGEFKGIRYDDSDVFKVIEGAAYSLAMHPDPELDKYLDDLITKIAAAQEDDGYLYTPRTIDPTHEVDGAGKTRWSYLEQSHELYNVGHMYEAAVAHYLATGKRSLLDIALKNADLVDSTFGPDRKRDVPGHEEIEIGLVKLYRVTGDERYLKLAKFFLDERGHANGRKLYTYESCPPYCQDHMPVIEQTEAAGHAVRAGYLYSGMADVAALTGDQSYIKAIDRIWEDVVTQKLYITGGIGAQHGGEAFGEGFELPNRTAYNETCAAIANMLWNHRLFLLHGDAKYMDVFERVLYNGYLSGVSLSGDEFFYTNPLESDGKYRFNYNTRKRQPWFGCSCCPTNVARFMPSLPGYVYAVRDDRLYVNLFVQSEATFDVSEQPVRVTQQTRYPWDGDVELTVTPDQAGEMTLCVRIPGWTRNEPTPSELYSFLTKSDAKVTLTVNGEAVSTDTDQGYARITRTWQPGDVVRLNMPMPIRRVVACNQVECDADRTAIERGPIVFCAEAQDNDGKVLNLVLPDDVTFQTKIEPDLLGGVMVLDGSACSMRHDAKTGELIKTKRSLRLIPYYAWAHRGPGEMEVWHARTPSACEPLPIPTIASQSKVTVSHTRDFAEPLWSPAAVNDLNEPKSSNDADAYHYTWWDHKGTAEWVQYDFAGEQTIAAVEVYWFDDREKENGGCRVPQSWRLLYKAGDQWQPVEPKAALGVEPNAFNRVEFKPVTTTGLRLEVQLQPEFSGGLLEWRVLK
ncbi:MAG: glycoside hydrolase family 127 protein [Phycisphaerae bacterium]|nr:glycoside hydrolase family 127 protein [Phycisphaerae bacterium]